MRPRPTLTPPALVSAWLLAGHAAFAQPDLPPPPPPPMAQPTEMAPAPAAPPPTPRTEGARPPPPATAPPPRPTAPASAPPSPRRPPRPVVVVTAPPPPPRRRFEPVFVEERGHPVALTIDPAPLVFGRLSGNVEFLVLPHHAFIVSPNVLVFPIDRGGRFSLLSEGFGFATRDSASFGLELGYHFWWRGRDALRGPYAGPSLLLGTTTQSSIDPSRALGYWGAALDAGIQEVVRGGFTIGGGAGLGLVHMSTSTAVFPRVLLQMGWSP